MISHLRPVGEAGAIFLLIAPGAGPAGTGEAQVAKADDVYASYYNPAGLGFLIGNEVAGMLADRRIIRQLAEFDIMLDKIGIASMFPELAESQSKLIDSFSYQPASFEEIISLIFFDLLEAALFGDSDIINAFNVALIILCGFELPVDFATISLMPKDSNRALIGPPAMIPVPGAADLKIIFPAPNFPTISW